MAPSRGITHSPSTSPSDDQALTQQSTSALATFRRNFSYLINPTAADAAGTSPARIRTRALLRSVRSLTVFLFWRAVKWAKYFAIGSLAAAVSATALGSVVTGVAWIAAPPTIITSVFASVVWGVGKYMARKMHKKWEREGKDEGVVLREEIEDGRVGTVRGEGSYGLDVGPSAVPW